ncbi:DUF5631 domain-containing protein [Mycolicibacter heraklionensis]|nr:DUF5631 domain-containing protein [Mycolicibacter heraklionensis]
MTEAIGLIAEANAKAAEYSSEANGKIIAATQQMFNELGIEGDAQKWLQDNGAKFSTPPPQPPTSEELSRKAAGTDQLPFPYGTGDAENHSVPKSVDELLLPEGPANSGAGGNDTGGTAGTNSGVANGQSGAGPGGTNGGVANGQSGAGPGGTNGGVANGTGGTNGGVANGQSGAGPGGTNGGVANGTGGTNGGVANGQSGPRVTITPASTTTGDTLTGQSAASSGALAPPAGAIPGPPAMGGGGGVPSPMASAMPGLSGPPGGGMPPGLPAGGPAQAFASGMPGGGPPGPGGPPPPLPPGGAGTGGFGQPSQIPPSPSVTPMAGGALGNMAQLASPSTEVAPAAPTAGATPATPTAPPVTASPASVSSGPISAGPAVPSGPLPGYGADLRPAAAAVPAAPTAPAGPAGPTPPPPPGGPTTPTSGGPTVASTGDRPPPGKPTPGAASQSGASVAGSMGAGTTAGAGAGTAARRLAEHQDLQRKVDAVARQAPNLAWAAGLRDDETTTVLATDLAGGWIPPTVKLPPGLTLLDPAHRRRDTSAVDLLGAVIAAAAHQPNTYVTEAGPNDPIPGSGERARYGQHVDELGPTLIDVTGTSDRLPRIVQTVARAVARRSGVADNEIALFRQVVTDTQTRVLSAYPQHAPRDVADWMLLAAIDALIDGSEELARYHLAWYLAVAVRHGGVTP